MMIGFFEGLDSKRGIGWHLADSLTLRQFLSSGLDENTTDHVSLRFVPVTPCRIADSSCKEELNAIREVAMRGSEIVRQLMIYAGKESTVVELVDLSTIVEEMLSLLKVSVTKRAVIKANLNQHLPAVPASAAQLRQIVMNLMTNASDAIGDRDGIIRVTTGRLTLKGESAVIASITFPDGNYVQLDTFVCRFGDQEYELGSTEAGVAPAIRRMRELRREIQAEVA